MSDPEIIGRSLRSCDYRCGKVHCPHKETEAHVTAAKWEIGDSQWTKWKVQ